ncbi:MAG: hypothetical protein ABFS32_23030 [Bacteroidota bacterium]
MKKKITILFSVTLALALTFVAFVNVQADAIPGIAGGGQIVQAPEGAKRPEWSVISFGGWAQGPQVGPGTGEWQINYHNVSLSTLDKATFHSTDITDINYFVGNSGTCNSALNMTMYGSLNGMPGYKVIFRAGDFGSPGYVDTVRVELYSPDGAKVFDTHGSEFVDQSSCVGSARTGLDAGNVTIVLP